MGEGKDEFDFRFTENPHDLKHDRGRPKQKTHRQPPRHRPSRPRHSLRQDERRSEFHPQVLTAPSERRCPCSNCSRDYELGELFILNPCLCCQCAACVSLSMQKISEQGETWKCSTCHQLLTHVCGLRFQRTLWQSFLQNPGVLTSMKKHTDAYPGITKEVNQNLERIDAFLRACVDTQE